MTMGQIADKSHPITQHVEYHNRVGQWGLYHQKINLQQLPRIRLSLCQQTPKARLKFSPSSLTIYPKGGLCLPFSITHILQQIKTWEITVKSNFPGFLWKTFRVLTWLKIWLQLLPRCLKNAVPLNGDLILGWATDIFRDKHLLYIH